MFGEEGRGSAACGAGAKGRPLHQEETEKVGRGSAGVAAWGLRLPERREQLKAAPWDAEAPGQLRGPDVTVTAGERHHPRLDSMILKVFSTQTSPQL